MNPIVPMKWFPWMLSLLLLPTLARAAWTYDDAAQTISDGNWVLNVKVEGDGLVVTGAQSASNKSTLDLRGEITSADGASREIVSVGGFRYDSSLQQVALPDTVRTVADYGFADCNGLKSVILPARLESIGFRAFVNGVNLASVTPFLPATVTNVGGVAFGDCNVLAGELDLSNPALKKIPDNTFLRTKITGLVLSDELVEIGASAFEGCGSLRTVTPFLPTSLEKMGTKAFRSCTILESDLYLVNQKMKSVAKTAFANCYKIRNVVLSEAETIETYAFCDCRGLKSIRFSAEIASMGMQALCNAYALRDVYFDGPRPTSFGSQCFFGIGRNQARCHYPQGDATWTEGTTPVTEDDLALYRSRFPGAEVLPTHIWNVPDSSFFLVPSEPSPTDVLLVASVPKDVGTVAPAYGEVSVAPNGTVTCTAPANALLDGTYYRCAGSVQEVETSPAFWEEIEGSRQPGTTATVVKVAGKRQRLTWLWEVAGFQLTISPGRPGTGTAEVMTPSEIGDAIYAPGTEVSLAVHPAAGYTFRTWLGDIPREKCHEATTTLLLDRPKSCSPVFSHDWLYDPSDLTITDGNWTIATTNAVDGGLVLTSVLGGDDRILLDLQRPVTESNGQRHRIVAVGERLFAMDKVLTELFLPEEGFRAIGDEVFQYCEALRHVEPFLPESLEKIGRMAFEGCGQLKEGLTLTNPGLGAVPFAAFYRAGITEATLTGAVVIGDGAFYQCGSLTNVVLSPRTELIGYEGNRYGAFQECGKLQSVTPFLPSSVTNIGDLAFLNCQKLKIELTLANPALRKIPFAAFQYSGIRNAVLTGPVVIGHGAFYSCSSLTNVVLSSQLKALESNNGRIGVFEECRALRTVTPFLPDTLEVLEGAAFQQCGSLRQDLRLVNPAVRAVPRAGFQSSGITSATLTGPTILGHASFWTCSSLTNVVLSDKLEEIQEANQGYGVFENCDKLKAVTPFLPSTLRVLQGRAFGNCPRLEGELKLSHKELVEVPAKAFHATSIRSAAIPFGEVIGDSAFAKCEELASVTLGQKPAVLRAKAFSGTATASIRFPRMAPLPPIGEEAIRCLPGDHRATLYGTLRRDAAGWQALVLPLTEEEKAICPKKTFGVLEIGGVRHWCVDYISPFDPKGMALILR